jgi:hypothetical protein
MFSTGITWLFIAQIILMGILFVGIAKAGARK